jgi:hypothetical protein
MDHYDSFDQESDLLSDVYVFLFFFSILFFIFFILKVFASYTPRYNIAKCGAKLRIYPYASVSFLLTPSVFTNLKIRFVNIPNLKKKK